MSKKKTTSKQTEVKGVKERYHFAGGGKYKPTSVEATSPSEALALWKKKREKVVDQTESKK